MKTAEPDGSCGEAHYLGVRIFAWRADPCGVVELGDERYRPEYRYLLGGLLTR